MNEINNTIFIYLCYMKFIISENKLHQFALNWMDKNFNLDDLEKFKSKKNKNLIFYKKNDDIVMKQDLKNGWFWFKYDIIWSFFENVLDMKYDEIQSMLKFWLEEHHGLKGLTIRLPME